MSVIYSKSIARARQGIYNMLGKTLPALKGTAYRDVISILKELEIYSEEYHNKSELSYTLNNSLLEFISVLTRPQKD